MRCHKTILLSVAALVPSVAHAGDIPDASYTPSSGNGVVDAARLSDAQTFTVLTSGMMSSASVDILYYSVPNADITLQIRTLVGGVPSEQSTGSTVLASATLPYSDVGTSFGWVNFDFPGFAVTSGEQLALVLTSGTTAGEYEWYADIAWPYYNDPAGTYAGGRGYDEGTSSGHLTWGELSVSSGNPGDTGNDPSAVDFAFQTFLAGPASSVPEPSAWALMLLGFGAIGAAMRRRNRHQLQTRAA